MRGRPTPRSRHEIRLVDVSIRGSHRPHAIGERIPRRRFGGLARVLEEVIELIESRLRHEVARMIECVAESAHEALEIEELLPFEDPWILLVWTGDLLGVLVEDGLADHLPRAHP